MAGKEDWLAFGLPIEGKLATAPTIGKIARREIPTCTLTELLGDVQDRVRQSGEHACVVLNKEGIVLGLVRKKLWDPERQALVEQVMESGPATFRPNVTVAEMAEYLREKKQVKGALVTKSDGRWMGMVRREDILKE